jgi:hypothetical protein
MDGMKRSAFIIAILVMAVTAICPAAGGHELVTAPRVGETRVVPTTFMNDPFILTRAMMGLGYGKADEVMAPLLEIDGDPVLGLEGDLLYAILGFEYMYAVRDWAGVWLQLTLGARLGNEVQSMLAQGISAYSGFELGWLLRLYDSDKHVLSTSISIRNSSSTIVDILGYVDGIIAGENPDLVKNSPVLGSSMDLRYAWAANDHLVLQALGQITYSETVSRLTGAEWYYGIGGVLSWDLTKQTDVPVGLAFGYKFYTIPDIGDDTGEVAHSGIVGIYYMGRPDFSLGLDIESQQVPLTYSDDPATFFVGVISMQYFF